jgi:hypothetical protein
VTERWLAVADLEGFGKLGLLERPAMILGLDLLDGGREGRVVLDTHDGRLFVE